MLQGLPSNDAPAVRGFFSSPIVACETDRRIDPERRARILRPAIVTAHGRVESRNNPGRGATFAVRLPNARPSGSVAPGPAASRRQMPAPAARERVEPEVTR
jgi:hypothetical protein